MDPYLEAPDLWPDLHAALAGEIRAELNLLLPLPYDARLEVRPEVGIVDDAGTARRSVPDVAVIKPSDASTAPATVTVSERRATLSASVAVSVAAEAWRHQGVEIRDASRGQKLIPLLEIVSPSHKRPGVDRRAYLRQQREVLESDASFVEIDLVRAGERLLPHAELEAYRGGLDPQPAYLVLVNRAWCRRGVEMAYQLFAVRLREVLPCIAISLREGEDEVKLDLQWVCKQAYDRAPTVAALSTMGEPPSHHPAMTSSLFRTFGECLEALPEMAGRGHRKLLSRSDRWPVGSRCRPLHPISC
jgi:hypothetical protein